MATVRTTFTTVFNSPDSKDSPIYDGRSGTGLTELTSAGTAALVQSGGADFSAAGDGVVRISSDGDVWLSFGTAPTAAVGTDFFLPSGTVIDVGVRKNDKISVIDDS